MFKYALCSMLILLILYDSAIAITSWWKATSPDEPQDEHVIKHRSNTWNDACVCVPLKDCPQLSVYLENHPVHPDLVEFLKNQNCGYHHIEPLVCCSNNYENLPPVPVPRWLSSEEGDEYDNEVRPKYYRRFHPRGSFHGDDDGEGRDYWGHFHHREFKPDRDEFPREETTIGKEKQPDITTEKLLESTTTESRKLPEITTTESGKLPEITTTEGGVQRGKFSGDTNKTEGVVQRGNLVPDQTCGLSLDSRIIGGMKAKLGSYPWIARLGYRRPGSSLVLYRCGGALVNQRYIITAAHCVNELPIELELTTIRLGEYDDRSNPDCEEGECADTPQDFIPSSIIAHELYNIPRFKNDIALVRLNRDANITPYVSPVCLPFDFMQSKNYTGLKATAAGWGTVNLETSSSSPVLQDVSLNISNPDSCASTYSTRFRLNVSETQMCTLSESGKDTCEGDSGGPLMSYELDEVNRVPRYYLLGIVSFGAKRCGTADLPAVFTRVSSYIDWIFINMKP